MKRTDSQSDQILHHLQAGHSITPMDALQLFGCFRLAARVYELARKGYPIVTEWETDGGAKKWARYSLVIRSPMKCDEMNQGLLFADDVEKTAGASL